MQVAVGLGWESCLDASCVLSFGEVSLNLLFYEADAFLLFIFSFFSLCHNFIELSKRYIFDHSK